MRQIRRQPVFLRAQWKAEDFMRHRNLYIQSEGTITINANDDGMRASNAAVLTAVRLPVESSVEALERQCDH